MKNNKYKYYYYHRVVMVLWLVAVATAKEEYDCTRGCAWKPAQVRKPVCDTDGIVYTTECLAVCQNVKLHPCPDHVASSRDWQRRRLIGDHDAEVVTVPPSVMDRFAGFVLVGKLHGPKEYTRSHRQPRSVSAMDDDDNNNNNDSNAPTGWVRLTSEGYEYRSLPTVQVQDRAPYRTDGLELDLQKLKHNRDRSLRWRPRQTVIVGPDERQPVPDHATTYPYQTMAEMDYGMGLSEGGCTGTLISRSSTLTAAHCVYAPEAGTWTSHRRLALGRYRRSNTTTVEPHGYWAIDYRTVYAAWQANGDVRYDIAVVTYKAKPHDSCGGAPHYFPGDAAGYVGLAAVSSNSDSDNNIINNATSISGYPWDRPDGTFWQATDCAWTPDLAHQAVWHTCDTAQGMSGAALMTEDARAVGVHAYGNAAEHVNLGIVLTPALYNDIYAWGQVGDSGFLPQCRAPNESPSSSSEEEGRCQCSSELSSIQYMMCVVSNVFCT